MLDESLQFGKMREDQLSLCVETAPRDRKHRLGSGGGRSEENPPAHSVVEDDFRIRTFQKKIGERIPVKRPELIKRELNVGTGSVDTVSKCRTIAKIFARYDTAKMHTMRRIARFRGDVKLENRRIGPDLDEVAIVRRNFWMKRLEKFQPILFGNGIRTTTESRNPVFQS